jgi:hypothetical protein
MDDSAMKEDSGPKNQKKTIITSSEINTHKIGNEYEFYKYDSVKVEVIGEPIILVLVGLDETGIFYDFKDPYENIIKMYGKYKFPDKTIIWQDTFNLYYMCLKLKCEYINHINHFNFFIANLYYDFIVSRKEGITTSVKTARLLFDNKTLHNDSVVYIFMVEDGNKFYYFISNEECLLEFYDKKLDPEIQIQIQIKNGICNSKIQDICTDDLDDNDDDEEMESNELAICISCGEFFFKEEDENEEDQTMCFYCINTFAEMYKDEIVHNPMDYPGYYDITTVRNIDLNRRDEIYDQPIIITMFFGLHGHGQIVNSNNKNNIKFTTRGSEYAKPYTSGYEVELSTFQSKKSNPRCRTHMVCIGSPLFFNLGNFTHNGITFNKKIDELFSEKDANVNSVVHGIIKDETDFHNFSEEKLKETYLTDDISIYGEKTAYLAYNNHLALNDRTWGIATNFGLNPIRIAEKYISGYSSEKDKMEFIKYNSIMDPAVDVKVPIVRALYCNISYKPDNTNSSKKIDEVIFLKNNSSLSSISSICQEYLINFYKKNINLNQKVELVSIIIDKTCNYSTEAIVFPHIPVSPKIIGKNFHGKYTAEGKGKTYKQKQSKQKRNQTKKQVKAKANKKRTKAKAHKNDKK